MSKNARRFRSLVITVVAVAATNAAIALASGVPMLPDSPRPKTSGVPMLPDSPRPFVSERTSGVPMLPDSPRPRTSGVPMLPDSPRP